QLIDVQLRAAGWECDTENINYKNKKTLPEKGKNKAIAEWPCGGKYADYADKINLSELDTRIQLIDVQLRAAGWECDTENINYKNKKTLPEKGK
ncbi:hypothetical protein BOQ62_22600, partial [Chryseobacterium sp. CH21]|uniref:hypothetical protein n=1 Tax=Chryseobacterium sp. CH21 TaxID=713556 RepID=UPI00102558B3